MTQLLDWLTKYPPPVVLLIVFVAALLFVTKLVVERSIPSYLDEKLRALKYRQNLTYARDALHPDKTLKSSYRLRNVVSMVLPSLFKEDDVERVKNGLGILAELARNYPYRNQEIIDVICSFVNKRWNKEHPYEEKWNCALATALKILAGFPKSDQNQHPYYVELTKLRIKNIDLKGVDFEHFVLWETEFIGVNMTRSNFCNTDLGGCIFAQNTSVEWSDFSGALMNVAFNEVVTTFDRVRLWGSKFNESRIDKCKMIISDGFDAREIKAKFKDRLEIVNI